MAEPVIEDFHLGHGRRGWHGVEQVARFTCRVRGIVLVNVSLMRAPDGELYLFNPLGRMELPLLTGARIVDEALTKRITRAAVARYAQTGTDTARAHRAPATGRKPA